MLVQWFVILLASTSNNTWHIYIHVGEPVAISARDSALLNRPGLFLYPLVQLPLDLVQLVHGGGWLHVHVHAHVDIQIFLPIY